MEGPTDSVEFKLIEDNYVTNSLMELSMSSGQRSTHGRISFRNFLKGGVKGKALLQVDWSRGDDAMLATSNIHAIEDLN